jgi:hypothetical protein
MEGLGLASGGAEAVPRPGTQKLELIATLCPVVPIRYPLERVVVYPHWFKLLQGYGKTAVPDHHAYKDLCHA